MRKALLVAAALAGFGVAAYVADAQTGLRVDRVISPAECLSMDESMGNSINGHRRSTRATEQLSAALRDVAPMLQAKPRLHEAQQALLAAAQEHYQAERKYLAALEDFQARLRECGRDR